MVESGTDGAWLRWSPPQCPFSIEYSARALDDIRLAVIDAFFSLPRGGAEIGGILLGTFDGARLSIHEYAALECEHAFGPSFTISLNDEARLRDLLTKAPAAFSGLQVVGWYHSHTRSGVFLSEADLQIHKTFFPEPYQVALVMKPHTFEPVRIGFFFRERDGSFHTESAYEELLLEPRPMRQLVRGAPEPVMDSGGAAPVVREIAWKQDQMEVEVTAEPIVEEPPPRIPVAAQTATAVAPAPAPIPEAPVEIRPAVVPQSMPEEPPAEAQPGPPVPQFLTKQPTTRSRRWLAVALGGLATIGAIGAAVNTRQAWMPRFVSAVRPAPTPLPPAPSMGLHTADFDGQLQINWDRFSPTVQQGTVGMLEIADGGPLPRSIALDLAHLQTGSFTYARQTEKVDVKLIVRRPDGQESREVTTFLGKLPERKAPVEDEEARKQREELAAEAEKLKTDLNSQAARTRKLEKDVQTMREEIRQQQRKRMLNQLPDGKK